MSAAPADTRAAARAEHARIIIAAAITAADPGPAVSAALADLDAPRHVHIVAIGKAAAVMGRAALAALPGAAAVTIVAPLGVPADPLPDGVRVVHGSHPLPDTASARAGGAVLEACDAAGDGDLVVVLISGGASALCIAPVGDIAPREYASVVDALLRAGASIQELNAVRAHIDALKGGGMLRRIAPARALGLVLSDVVGNPLDIIASGPLTPARATPDDAIAVLERHRLWAGSVPDSMRAVLTRARPQPAVPAADVRVILDNEAARAGAASAARRLGYDVRVLPDSITGPAREAGRRLAGIAINAAGSLPPGASPLCIVAGGETTVVVRGSGVGGRNQELALAAAIALDGRRGITIASAGTDGIDGPTDAAGAIVDGSSVTRGHDAHRPAAHDLENNDSHSFFRSAGGLIRTGATGTNVMDVQLALVDPAD